MLSIPKRAWGNSVRAIHQSENSVSEAGTKDASWSVTIHLEDRFRPGEPHARKHWGVKPRGDWEEPTTYSELLEQEKQRTQSGDVSEGRMKS